VSGGPKPDHVRAVVREIDGQLVLDDPDALAVMTAVAYHNCRATLAAHGERVSHFQRRVRELGRSNATTLIVVINADEPLGEEVAAVCGMPKGWADTYRAQRQIPFARGLVDRAEMQELLDVLGDEPGTSWSTPAETLRAAKGLPVLVLDHGIIAIFDLGG